MEPAVALVDQVEDVGREVTAVAPGRSYTAEAMIRYWVALLTKPLDAPRS